MSYISSHDRHQILLFNSLDDAIGTDHLARLLDVLVDQMVKADPDFFLDRGKSKEGRPAYHPTVFLKLYLYGALNGISSSRKLERECKRNLELMWLLGKLAPDFKTIADYRKDQGEQIQSVFLRVNLFLKQEGLIKGKIVSLDGSKIRAYASQSISKQRLEALLVEEKLMLEQYMATLAAEDAFEAAQQEELAQYDPQDPGPSSFLDQEMEAKLMEAITESHQKIQQAEELLAQAQADGNDQKRICTTDPDARIMKGREGKHWSYNIQANIDQAYGLICDIEATSICVDKQQLISGLIRLKDRMGIIPEKQLADAGYGNIQQIIDLQQGKIEGLPAIECFIPNSNLPGEFDQKNGNRFVYHQQQDHYTCVEGEILKLIQKDKMQSHGATASVYRAGDCRPCTRKEICAPKAKVARSTRRYDNQQARDEYRAKIESKEGQEMRVERMSLSEHPFGTLKAWMGKPAILMRGRHKVNTQIKIFATAYNILRCVNIKSVAEMIQKAQEFDWKATVEGLLAQKKIIRLNSQFQIFRPRIELCLAA